MAEYKSIHKSKRRLEAYEKVNGTAIYGNDIAMENMLYAYGVPAKYPFAWIKNIDVSEAEKMPGVACVLTSADIPGSKVMGDVVLDEYILATDRVITTGDCVAVVYAESIEEARVAGAKVRVDYVIEQSLTEYDPALNSDIEINPHYGEGNLCCKAHINKGDIDKALEEAEVKIESHYECTWQEHAYIEPETVIVYPGQRKNELIVTGSLQALYNPRLSIHRSLNIPMANITVVQSTIGGSFGGKLEGPEKLAVRAAMGVLKTGRPVKYSLTREESIKQTYKRHPYTFDMKVSATKDGMLTGFYEDTLSDTGAYANMAPDVLYKTISLSAGPYVIPNVRAVGKTVYTNNISTGSFRGFGNPQGIYARECSFDDLARALNMSPYQLRKKNVMHRGDASGSNQIIDFEDIGAEECLDLVAKQLDFDNKYFKYIEENKNSTIRRGVGLSLSYRGNSYGFDAPDIGRVSITVEEDGSVLFSSGLTEVGQGLHTIMSQIVAEALCISDDDIIVTQSDTSRSPHTSNCTASRGTFVGGRAILDAAKKIHNCLATAMAEKFNVSVDDISFETDIVHIGDMQKSFKEVVGIAYQMGYTPAFVGTYKIPVCEFDIEKGTGDSFYEFTYSCIGVELEIDTCTGQVKVLDVASAHDVGRCINPLMARGQMFGGSVMAQGYSLYEDIKSEGGVIKHLNYDEYLIPGIMDIPDKQEAFIVENPNDRGPYGARSLGEPAFDPGLGAFVNAINNALDGIGHVNSNPVNLENIIFNS